MPPQPHPYNVYLRQKANDMKDFGIEIPQTIHTYGSEKLLSFFRKAKFKVLSEAQHREQHPDEYLNFPPERSATAVRVVKKRARNPEMPVKQPKKSLRDAAAAAAAAVAVAAAAKRGSGSVPVPREEDRAEEGPDAEEPSGEASGEDSEEQSEDLEESEETHPEEQSAEEQSEVHPLEARPEEGRSEEQPPELQAAHEYPAVDARALTRRVKKMERACRLVLKYVQAHPTGVSYEFVKELMATAIPDI